MTTWHCGSLLHIGRPVSMETRLWRTLIHTWNNTGTNIWTVNTAVRATELWPASRTECAKHSSEPHRVNVSQAVNSSPVTSAVRSNTEKKRKRSCTDFDTYSRVKSYWTQPSDSKTRLKCYNKHELRSLVPFFSCTAAKSSNALVQRQDRFSYSPRLMAPQM